MFEEISNTEQVEGPKRRVGECDVSRTKEERNAPGRASTRRTTQTHRCNVSSEPVRRASLPPQKTLPINKLFFPSAAAYMLKSLFWEVRPTPSEIRTRSSTREQQQRFSVGWHQGRRKRARRRASGEGGDKKGNRQGSSIPGGEGGGSDGHRHKESLEAPLPGAKELPIRHIRVVCPTYHVRHIRSVCPSDNVLQLERTRGTGRGPTNHSSTTRGNTSAILLASREQTGHTSLPRHEHQLVLRTPSGKNCDIKHHVFKVSLRVCLACSHQKETRQT